MTSRCYWTKVNNNFSSCAELLKDIYQASVLRPLLFSIYLNDLLFLPGFTDYCNFADDTAFHACDKNLSSLINKLKHDSLLAVEGFASNNMKLR